VGSFFNKETPAIRLLTTLFEHFRAAANSIYYRNSNSSIKNSDFVCGFATKIKRLNKLKKNLQSRTKNADGTSFRLAVATTVEFSGASQADNGYRYSSSKKG
jgi:hypothetical protein